MASFSQAPAGSPAPFVVSIPSRDIEELKTLLSVGRIAKTNYENSQTDGRFGISRDWLVDAVKVWRDAFDWRKHESAINSVPNFKTEIEDEGDIYQIHFAALFSQRKDATPLLLLHGWPGSFLEFLPLLFKLRDTYASDPGALPYHIIVPSLPGFGFSSIPTNKDFRYEAASRIVNNLMIKLGFARGYIAQGGDIGSEMAKELVSQYDEVKAAHVNMHFMFPPGSDVAPPTPEEQETLKRCQKFATTGMGYAIIQATRPSTIGLVVGSSPVSLLAWIGEKMYEWSGIKPALEDVLVNVSLYWFTGCLPTSVWIYRKMEMDSESNGYTDSLEKIKKPFGYSWFPDDISACPRSWAETTGRISFYRAHKKGGHFAAWEQPDIFWQDIVDFVDHVKELKKI